MVKANRRIGHSPAAGQGVMVHQARSESAMINSCDESRTANHTVNNRNKRALMAACNAEPVLDCLAESNWDSQIETPNHAGCMASESIGRTHQPLLLIQ